MKQLRRFAWPAYLTLLFAVASATFVVEGFGHTFAKGTHEAEVTCVHEGQRIIVHATNNGFEPSQLQAHACDVLVFQNETNDFIEVALGTHDHHLAYPGLTEGVTKSGGEKYLTLTKKGTYVVHDHLNDSHHARLTVE